MRSRLHVYLEERQGDGGTKCYEINGGLGQSAVTTSNPPICIEVSVVRRGGEVLPP